jgi:uncharacterized Fe-S cluster protein YjdI/CDGSH-type Zn-finger protein
MRRNPRLSDHAPGSPVRSAQQDFNVTYCTVLGLLEQTFNGHPHKLDVATAAMFHLKSHAEKLMQMAPPDGSGVAGPTFEYVPPGERHAPTAAVDSSGATSTYVGPGITIHWDGARCIHAQRCTSGAPDVFDRAARPWVHPGGAPANEIAAVIDTCPSGALSYTRTDGLPNGRRGRAAGEDPAASTAADPERSFFSGDLTGRSGSEVPVTITPQADGPLLIEGTVGLKHPDGSVEGARRLTLCRCGRSGSKPNCDGTHVRVGFRAPGAGSPSES